MFMSSPNCWARGYVVLSFLIDVFGFLIDVFGFLIDVFGSGERLYSGTLGARGVSRAGCASKLLIG